MTDETPFGSGAPPPGIRIRPAKSEDAAQVSRILAEAFPSLYSWAFGRLSTEQTATLLHALYDADTLTLTTTQVAEQNGLIAGVALLHIGDSIGRGTMRAYWNVVRSQLHLVRGVRAFAGGVFANWAIHKRIPHDADLVYVEALAVGAAYRGQGIGTCLLIEAAAWGLARSRPRMALHVLQSNKGARRLYERMGFRLSRPEPRPAQPGSRRQSWVSLLMTREAQS